MTDYRFEIYVNGKLIEHTGSLTLEQAQDYYMANYGSHLAVRLFVNNKPIAYVMTAKTLNLRKDQCMNLYDKHLIRNQGG